MNTELILYICAATGVTQLVVRLVYDGIANRRNNGHSFCGEHALFKRSLASLERALEEKAHTDRIAKAVEIALKRNGK